MAAWVSLDAEGRHFPPWRSVAVTLSSAAGLVGGLGPLAVGLIAGAFGLTVAMAVLAIVPVAVLAGSAGGGRTDRRRRE
jgi:hypothetical protein